MRFCLTILILFLVQLSGLTQNSKSELDFINEKKFEPEGQVRGIGILEAYQAYGKDIIIYDSKGNPKIKIRVSDDDVTVELDGKRYSRHDNTDMFSPRFFGNNPDYFRLIFDCAKSTDEYYQVIINQKSKATAYIKKTDSLFKFVTLVEFVNEHTDMGLNFDRVKNPLRLEPTDNAKILPNEYEKKYSIWRAEKIEMRGDWLKVKTKDNEEGWIRWREGDKVLIELYFFC